MVSGGLGDIGRLVGIWAAGIHFASYMFLLGRSGRMNKSNGGLTVNSSLKYCIVMQSCDLTQSSDASSCLGSNGLQTNGAPPIVSTFHAAAVLQDSLLVNQTSRSVRAVYAPKINGAENLATQTHFHPLAGTVYFSSLSAQLGTPGQSNYAAANSAVDSVAQSSLNTGLPYASVMWGPWASGMALDDPAVLARFERAGLTAITPTSGMRIMQDIIMTASVMAATIAGHITWNRLLKGRSDVPLLFEEFAPPLHEVTKATRDVQKLASDRINISVDTRSPNNHHLLDLLPDAGKTVRNVVVEMLGSNVSDDQPLMEAGLDSLGNDELQQDFVWMYN